MAMTKLEVAAKDKIKRILKEQGYPTYAKLFDIFDLNLTEDPNVIGYMVPTKAKIVINKNLSKDQVSLIVRHEILHEFLNHGPRGQKFEKQKYKDLFGKEGGSVGNHELSNMAADWEISNRGYTDNDKITSKNIILDGKILQGLVTELDNPGKGWENLTYEQMYDKLLDQYKDNLNDVEKLKQQLKDQLGPQIGDTGNEDIQNAEEIERQANAIIDDAGDAIDQAEQDLQDAEDEDDKEGQADAKKTKAAAEKSKDIASKVADAAKDLKQQEDEVKDISDADKVFKDDKQLEKERKIAERRKKLLDILNDASNLVKLEKEVEINRDKEKAAKAAADAEKYRANPLNAFKMSLNDFIAREIAHTRGGTWRKFNKNSISQGIIKKGITSRSSGFVPSINVYFDRSGSFSGFPEKTVGAERAIAALNQYVQRGQLKINLYYVTTEVYSSRSEAERTYGGMNSDVVVEHIKATKPDNVIVLTDSDANYGDESATVPGGVWFLFYDSDAPDFVTRLRGKKATKAYQL